MLSDKGFKRKRYADIVESLENRAVEHFGSNINLSPRQFLGILIRIIAFFSALFAKDLEKTYNAAFYQTSEGVDLDKNAGRQGMARQLEEKSIGTVLIEVDEGTMIDTGLIVGTKTGVGFVTTQSKRGTGESVRVEIEALEAGQEGNVPAGSITEVITPIVGVSGVINDEPTTGGRDRETDDELRQRIERVRGIESRIVLYLMDIEGVRDVYLDFNQEGEEVDGLPPHSIAPIVWGGDESEIAQTISRNKSHGIRSFGDIEITVKDSKQKDQIIGFSRPIQKDIFINIEYEGAASKEDVRSAIIEYIGGQDQDGSEYDGLGINNHAIHFKALNEIGSVGGIQNATLEWSTDGSTFNKHDIEVARTEYVITNWQDVDVMKVGG